jgi:hypothetical protein
VLIIGYAICDLKFNPWLRGEESYSLEPDIHRIGDLLHWGGRLWQQDPALLLANALIVAGLLALATLSIIELIRRLWARKADAPHRNLDRASVFPQTVHQSDPPPA